jgi:hypothetical protein
MNKTETMKTKETTQLEYKDSRGCARGFKEIAPSHDFQKGRADRVLGLPCRSANGAYLDGWYSVSNNSNQNK